MINEGDKAPALKVTSSDGSTVDLVFAGSAAGPLFLSEGRYVGLHCSKHRTSPQLAPDFKKAGVKVVGVSRDPMKKHEKFIAKYDLAVPLASDEDGKISDAFGTWVEKSMYGRKYMGMERATYLIGADGKVIRAWRKVKVPGHAQEVLKAAS